MLDNRTPPDTEILVSELIDEYLDDCRIRNLSPTTIARYDGCLRTLLDAQWDSPLALLSIRDVRAVMASRLESYSPATVNRDVRALKAFLYFALDNDYPVPFHPRKLKKVKEPKRVPPCFSQEQVEALLAQPKRNTFTGLRNYTMMCLMLDVGPRLSELTGLRRTDVNLPHLKVFGKMAKERILAMSDPMVKSMRKYLRVRDRVVSRGDRPTELLFPSRLSTQLTASSVNSMLKRYAAKTRVEGVRVSAHTFRYTYTSMAVRNGMSLTRRILWMRANSFASTSPRLEAVFAVPRSAAKAGLVLAGASPLSCSCAISPAACS